MLARPNLTVLIDTRITRLLFDPSGSEPRAVGVEIAQSANGKRFRIAATKEVILSAGAIGTPQILMASGVGPKNVLDAAGVEVLKDMPHVGKNLIDVSRRAHFTSSRSFARQMPSLELFVWGRGTWY